MTSEERRESRYRRRAAKRAAKKAMMSSEWDDYAKVFTYSHLYASYKKCRRGIGWKASAQKYAANAPLNVFDTYSQLKQRGFCPGDFYEFDILERGKPRHIRSVTLRERVVQRCLCDYSMVPILSRSFIYDNGACLKGKGYSFSQQRCIKHLHDHYRQYGADGYVLTFDFRHFFDNVSHEELRRKLNAAYSDQELLSLATRFIDKFGDIGLGLGSQVSQVLALASADRLDHFIKEILRIHGYGRYMDDGYLIHPDKEYLRHCLAQIRMKCDELGIILNEKKTHIVPLRKGFTFLKIRLLLVDGGKIIRIPCKANTTRMRRKLKKFLPKVERGEMTTDDVHQSFQSWRSHILGLNAYRAINNTELLYKQLYSH